MAISIIVFSPLYIITYQTMRLLHSRCQPTCHGLIRSAKDALLVLEACLQGHLLHAPRGLFADEALHAVQPGSIFVYELRSSGVRDWNDFRLWDQETQLGDFRIQTERVNGPDLGCPSSEHRAGGVVLMKQSIMLQWNQTQHHIVSYFSRNGPICPRWGGLFNYIQIRQELLQQQQHLRHPVGFDPFIDSAVRHKSPGGNEALSPDTPLKGATAKWEYLLHEFHRLGWRMVDGRPRRLDTSTYEAVVALMRMGNGKESLNS